jgi:succinate-semialdehyde dehydrogenase/glutarate-semialdehyde dehydrogenase
MTATMAQTTAGTRSSFATVNPYTNELVREFPSLSGEEVDRVVERAHRASQPWRERAVEERARVVSRRRSALCVPPGSSTASLRSASLSLKNKGEVLL